MKHFRSATLSLLGASLLTTATSAFASDLQSDQPALIVVVSIDQFRGDYVSKFTPHFGTSGMNRILEEGFWFENCRYQHVSTYTAPGHATLLSGSYGHLNGIVANNWFEKEEDQVVYCVGDSEERKVLSSGVLLEEGETWPPQPQSMLETDGNEGSHSPHRLLSETVGDLLEMKSQGRSHTVSISWKDRAAILMAGRGADTALWFDRDLGEYITSTWYRDRLPDWAIQYNESKSVDQWFKKPWTLSLDESIYELVCTPDSFPGESTGGFEKNTFPHVHGWNSASPDKAYYNNMYYSPFSNQSIIDIAERAISEEGLGQDEHPDLLTLGFSSNDPTGHAFGPDSWEVFDAAIKTDEILAELMDLLDERVPDQSWTLFLTADHGVAHLPEYIQQFDQEGGRISLSSFAGSLDGFLKINTDRLEIPESGSFIKNISVPWIILDLPENKDTARKVKELTRDWLRDQDTVRLAHVTEDLLEKGSSLNRIEEAILRSYFPGRAGDVAFALEPNFFFGGNDGTTHGSPYSYDQHVPLMAIGKGIKQGTSNRFVEPPMIAPTIAELVHVRFPNNCETNPLYEALEQ